MEIGGGQAKRELRRGQEERGEQGTVKAKQKKEGQESARETREWRAEK